MLFRIPQSVTVHVEHACTQGDRDYAVSAAKHFGTSHREFLAHKPYGCYLIDAIAATGEPPNHVQSVYFQPLARFMAGQGIGTGLCGEGADSLFGTEYGPLVHRAAIPAKAHSRRSFAAMPWHELPRRWGERRFQLA